MKKIVIRVRMDCDKCRSKAFKIAADANGVSSVALGGNDKEKLVVVGEEVDSVCLTRTLRKKFKHAMIESVEEVKDKKEEKKEENLQLPPWWSYPPCPPTVVHVPESDGVCIVM